MSDRCLLLTAWTFLLKILRINKINGNSLFAFYHLPLWTYSKVIVIGLYIIVLYSFVPLTKNHTRPIKLIFSKISQIYMHLHLQVNFLVHCRRELNRVKLHMISLFCIFLALFCITAKVLFACSQIELHLYPHKNVKKWNKIHYICVCDKL